MHYTHEYRTWADITEYLEFLCARRHMTEMAEGYQRELAVMRSCLEGIPGITVSLVIPPTGLHRWEITIGGNAFQDVLLRSVCHHILATPGIADAVRAAVCAMLLHDPLVAKEPI